MLSFHHNWIKKSCINGKIVILVSTKITSQNLISIHIMKQMNWFITKAFWKSERTNLTSQPDNAQACLPHRLQSKQCKGMVIWYGLMLTTEWFSIINCWLDEWESKVGEGAKAPSKSSSSKSISSSSSSSDPSVTGAAPFCQKKRETLSWMKQKLRLTGESTVYELCHRIK